MEEIKERELEFAKCARYCRELRNARETGRGKAAAAARLEHALNAVGTRAAALILMALIGYG